MAEREGDGMNKYIVMGGYEPYIIEAEDWESAFWQAYQALQENLASITVIPEVTE